jgi:hypothetical protein
VFVSFTPLLPLCKKDCGSVKVSWTKKQCSSPRQSACREAGPNRLFSESLGVEEFLQLFVIKSVWLVTNNWTQRNIYYNK